MYLILFMATLIANSIYRTHSKAISCSKQFCISSDPNPGSISQLLFQAPASTVISEEILAIGSYVHFTILKSDLEMIAQSNLEIHHIVE